MTMPPKILPSLAVSVAFALVICVLSYRFMNAMNPAEGTEDKLQDFRDVLYYPGLALREGVNPYDSEALSAAYPADHFPLYSPLIIVTHLPLSFLSETAAVVTYYVITIVLTVVLAACLIRVCGLEMNYFRFMLGATLLLASRPGHQSILNGQCTTEVVLACVLALYYARSSPLISGVFLAMATMKPTFGVPLAICMFCRRDDRAVSYGLVLAVIGALVPLSILTEAHGVDAMLTSLNENLHWHGTHKYTHLETTYSRVDSVLVISRLFGFIPSKIGELVVSGLVLLLGGIAIAQVSRAGAVDKTDGLTAAISCTAVVLFFYHQSYDMLLLSLPLALIAVGRRRIRTSLTTPTRRLLLFCLIVPLANYAATAYFASRLQTGGPTWTGLTLVNGVLILTAYGILVWHALCQQATGESVP